MSIESHTHRREPEFGVSERDTAHGRLLLRTRFLGRLPISCSAGCKVRLRFGLHAKGEELAGGIPSVPYPSRATILPELRSNRQTTRFDQSARLPGNVTRQRHGPHYSQCETMIEDAGCCADFGQFDLKAVNISCELFLDLSISDDLMALQRRRDACRARLCPVQVRPQSKEGQPASGSLIALLLASGSSSKVERREHSGDGANRRSPTCCLSSPHLGNSQDNSGQSSANTKRHHYRCNNVALDQFDDGHSTIPGNLSLDFCISRTVRCIGATQGGNG